MSKRQQIMTPYRAVGLAEGFEEGTDTEITEAWAFLISTGMCWSLQGWFGRTAQSLIESGVISPTGVILNLSNPDYDN